MTKSFLCLVLFMTLGLGVNARTSIAHPRIDSVYICQSKSAYAYHAFECRGLTRCTHMVTKITKAQALRLGYKPCKICYR